MTNKEWAVANLTGKVLNRAIRAIEEQPEWESESDCRSLASMIFWDESREGYDYWIAVSADYPNPDQQLPPDYVEAPEYVGEVEKKDEFLEWLEDRAKRARPSSDYQMALKTVLNYYKELKNSNQ
jgi:hypothetical protein